MCTDAAKKKYVMDAEYAQRRKEEGISCLHDISSNYQLVKFASRLYETNFAINIWKNAYKRVNRFFLHRRTSPSD